MTDVVEELENLNLAEENGDVAEQPEPGLTEDSEESDGEEIESSELTVPGPVSEKEAEEEEEINEGGSEEAYPPEEEEAEEF